MKWLLSAFACGLVLSTGYNAEVPKHSSETARAKYARSPATPLNVVEPVTISRVFEWKDGGTVGMELTGANGKKLTFCMYSPGGAGLPIEDKKPKIILNVFIGAPYPTQKGAKMVEFRGPEESALYGVLLRAIDKHSEKDVILAKAIDEKLWESRKLWGTDMLAIHTVFHRLESHFLK